MLIGWLVEVECCRDTALIHINHINGFRWEPEIRTATFVTSKASLSTSKSKPM